MKQYNNTKTLPLRASQIAQLATIGTGFVVSGEDKPFLTEKGVSEIITAYEKMRTGAVIGSLPTDKENENMKIKTFFTPKLPMALNNMLVAVKKWLPTFNCYKHKNGVSITPHFGYQWYRYTSEVGDMKAQIHLGWIMWSCQLIWKHNA